MKLKKVSVAIALVLVSGSSWASGDCSDDYSWFANDRYKNKGLVSLAVVCRFWHATGSTILAASIKRVDGVDLEVAVIDPVAKKVIDASYQKGALSDGGIYSSTVRIDTADYRLDSSASAFGVRIRWEGSSQPNPYSAETIDLYSIQDGKLVKIMNRLAVHEGTGAWDTRCAGEFTTRDMILIMDSSAAKGGISDIVVKEKVRRTTRRDVSGVCLDSSQALKSKSYVIPYQNNRYETPQKLRVLE